MLLPGSIVPVRAAVDREFHTADEELLQRLGAVSEPAGELESVEPWFD